MSSRNRLLSPREREIATALPDALKAAGEAIAAGADPAEAIAAAKRKIENSGFEPAEYLELRDADNLAPMTTLDRPARLLVAARIGTVRLIDNLPVQPAA